ncbi:retrovirus-related pol polyprotein from transposon TNT 1-94 [Tanacetum coccineum]
MHKQFWQLVQKMYNMLRTRERYSPVECSQAPKPQCYYQAPKPQRSNATSSSTRQSASTRHKGKEVAKPITPQSESVSEEDSDPEQAQRDKEMQKNLALLAKYFKKLYKPTNNNLRTSSNSRNKTEDTTPRYNNDNQSRQFGNQRTMTVAGARETVGSQVVQQTGIQCFNCKGYGHYAKECRKPKRVKDYAYHKEKMMMCKQAEQGVPLQAEQADWLEDTDEEIDEQELEAHYSYMAKIQEVSPEESSSTGQPLEQVQNHDESNVYDNVRRHSEQPESINDTYVLKKDDSNVTPDSSNICTNDNQVDQNAAECVDERVALANLIANLTLDTEENKTILKQLKKANASLTQELEKCKTNLDETNSALGEAISCRDSCLIALQNKQNEFEKYKAFNDRTIDYEILQTKLNETLGLLALKDIEIKEGLKTKAYEISVLNQKHDELVKKSLLTRSQLEGYLKENTKVISDLKVKEEKDIDKMIEMDKQLKFLNEIVYTRNQSIQTIHMLAPKCATYNGRLTFANPRYLKKAQSEKPRLYEIPYDTSDPANRFAPDREETMTLDNESRLKLNKDYVKPYDYTKQNSLYEIFKAPSLEYLYQLERGKESNEGHVLVNTLDSRFTLQEYTTPTLHFRTGLNRQDDSSRSGNDTDADDADIRPIYDEEPMAEVQLTVECNIFAIGQQHTEQPKIIIEGRVDHLDPQMSNDVFVHNCSGLNLFVKRRLKPKRFKLQPQCHTEVHRAAETVTNVKCAGFAYRAFVQRIFSMV